MLRDSWIVLVVVSSLLPIRALADDAEVAVTDTKPLNPAVFSSHTTWLDPSYSLNWQLAQPVEPVSYLDDDAFPIANLDFHDSHAFARVSKVRELSLLTLAEVSGARLFFGINDDGLFGFHLGPRPSLGDERCVELVRMPYLRNEERDGLTR